MKIVSYYLILALVLFLINSCEENFSPKSDYQEKYILYSIINIDSSVQSAVLQKSYNVDGLDPYQNTNSTFIKGADIRIRQRDNVFFMRDTSTIRIDTSRYKSLFDFYYIDDFFVQGNDSLEILITMPNGKKLYSIAAIPNSITFNKASDNTFPAEDKEYITFIWNGPVSTRYYLSKLSFYYIKDGVRYSKEVPVEYKLKAGKWNPVYPSITNNNVMRFR